MSNVYYRKIDSHTTVEEVQNITRELLDVIIENEEINLEKRIPLKVHFGEEGNISYIKSENFEGIIGFLKERDIETCYIESTVMYGGSRCNRELHLKTAEAHGFNQVPIVIADGEEGEAFEEVEINKKHFKNCCIGEEYLNYDQIIVLSHFKGHMLGGFGGAIKQLSMGLAAKGGKLSMHTGIKPKIKNKKCKKCNLCIKRCNENAITIEKVGKSFIDHERCIGCGACLSICPHQAVSIMTPKALYNVLFQRNAFREKLVEYAFAGQKDKRNIYMNFAMNVTKGCDCEPKKMKPIMDDFGIFISTDPVAIDKACYDLTKERGKAFKGSGQFQYAVKIGLGSTNYNLIDAGVVAGVKHASIF